MYIPHQIHKQSINENRLVPSEIPLQPLHPNHNLLIDTDGENRVVVPLLQPFLLPLAAAAAAFNQDIVLAAGLGESSFSGIQSAPRTVLLPRNQAHFGGGRRRPQQFLGQNGGFVGQVAEDEGNFGIDQNDDVEPVEGFRAGVVAGGGEIPIDVEFGIGSAGVDRAAALLLAEEAGAGVELEGGRAVGDGEPLGPM
ncbi:unnamed protein product [Linum tenue]|uniref:Uncharacterized protein n=1 Tax=Linum tenue TaxID=586396 RepID=A0AAV0QJM6_9ROSI|nr:unnamed protein product [Linum tenue]